nr:hypothetical protein [Tanacetum cinerariifolium]
VPTLPKDGDKYCAEVFKGDSVPTLPKDGDKYCAEVFKGDRSWKEIRIRSPDRLLGFPSGFPLGMVPQKNLDERNSLFPHDSVFTIQNSLSTHSQQSFPIYNKYNPQLSLNHNFMQPPITSLEDINGLTEAINAALILFAKAFQLTAPTNNNQRTSSNPRNRQISQNGGIQGAQNASQNAGVQSGGNQNRLVVVTGIANQNGTSNVATARTEGTGIGNQARCYNCRGLGHIARNCTDRPRRRDAAYLQTQLLIAQKEEVGIQLQAKEFDFMAAAVETSSTTNEETCAHQETVYRNLVDQVAQKDKFLDKEVDLEARIKDLENILLKRDQIVQTMHMLNPKPDLFYHPNQKMALGYPHPSYLKKAQLKQQSLYDGNLLLEEHDPPAVHDSEETLKLTQESREKMRFLKKEIKPTNYAKINHLSGVFVPQTTKSKEELFLSNVSNMVTVSKMISIPNEDLSDDTTLSVARKFLNKFKLSLKKGELEPVTPSALNVLSVESEVRVKDCRTRIPSGTSVTPLVDKPKISAVTPQSKKLHTSMPSHSVPQPREFNVVKHRNEPMRKRFPNSTMFLGRLSKFVCGASTRVVPSI